MHNHKKEKIVMIISTISSLHILLGTVGLLAGAAALFSAKGAKLHRSAGNVFFVSMLVVSAIGSYIAYVKSDIPFSTALFTCLLGVFTFYLVATSWVTVKRRAGERGLAEIAGLLFILATAIFSLTIGVDAAMSDTVSKNGAPPMPVEVFYFFAGLAIFLALGDIWLIVRGGISGSKRISRHLWRMCMALFISVGILFMGNPQVFPMVLQKAVVLTIPVLAMPALIILVLMVYWLIKLMFTKSQQKSKQVADEVMSV
jgi:uncharacterized membrane protein